MGKSAEPRYAARLVELLTDSQGRVRAAAHQALEGLFRGYTEKFDAEAPVRSDHVQETVARWRKRIQGAAVEAAPTRGGGMQP
jgi:hypothetical protein